MTATTQGVKTIAVVVPPDSDMHTVCELDSPSCVEIVPAAIAALRPRGLVWETKSETLIDAE